MANLYVEMLNRMGVEDRRVRRQPHGERRGLRRPPAGAGAEYGRMAMPVAADAPKKPLFRRCWPQRPAHRLGRRHRLAAPADRQGRRGLPRRLLRQRPLSSPSAPTAAATSSPPDDGKKWQTGKKDAQVCAVRPRPRLRQEDVPGARRRSRRRRRSPAVRAAHSADGVAWSDPRDIPGKNILRRLAFGNGIVRRRRRPRPPRRFEDGKDWQDAPDVKAMDTLVDVAFGKGVFVGVGLHGLRMTQPRTA